jgi:hypothetical protein
VTESLRERDPAHAVYGTDTDLRRLLSASEV